MQGHEITGAAGTCSQAASQTIFKNFGFFSEGDKKPWKALSKEVHDLISVLKTSARCYVQSQLQSSSREQRRGRWNNPDERQHVGCELLL